MIKKINVAVFILLSDGKVLLEKRTNPNDGAYHNKWLYPAGTVEDHELEEFGSTLKRELLEEFGVTPLEYVPIPFEGELLSETGVYLHPFLITKWQGELPENILDDDLNPLMWLEFEKAVESEVGSVKNLSLLVKNFLDSKV